MSQVAISTGHDVISSIREFCVQDEPHQQPGWLGGSLPEGAKRAAAQPRATQGRRAVRKGAGYPYSTVHAGRGGGAPEFPAQVNRWFLRIDDTALRQISSRAELAESS